MAARRVVSELCPAKALDGPTNLTTPSENKGENLDWTNLGIDHPATKNAGAVAAAPGVNSNGGHQNPTPNNTRKKISSAMTKFAKDAHKRTARVVGYALTLGTVDAWADASYFLSLRLTHEERASLAWAAMRSSPPDIAEAVAASILCTAGAPSPIFLGCMKEARFWASIAAPRERKAFALASFEAMPRPDQMAFIRHISQIGAAA